MTLRAFRVGVVGARRARQGTGAYLALDLHAAGAKVVAVAGTSRTTAATAAAALAPSGMVATPYDDVSAMIGAERLDALVIASPHEAHEASLGLGLAAGLHILCEKPLLVPDEHSIAVGTGLLEAFAARHLLLAVNAQWRHALGAYMQLFPDVVPRAATTFEMELSPRTTGLSMIADALPHPLSLLDHLFPVATPGLRDVEVCFASAHEATLRFTHPGGARGVRVVVRLSNGDEDPRPAAFGFDGRLARREVSNPGYRLFLRADAGHTARREGFPYPTDAVARRFVERVRKGPPFPIDSVTRAGLVHLYELVAAAARVAPRGVGG